MFARRVFPTKMAEMDADDRSWPSIREVGTEMYRHFWDVLLTGVAIIVPVVITLYLAQLAIGLVREALSPLILFVQHFGIVYRFQQIGVISLLIELDVYYLLVEFLAEFFALIILFAVVMVVGSVGHNRYGEHIIDFIDLTIASIPGVGTVYKSFRRMGDVMLDSETENFQDIKLVRCLGEEMYVLGFETSVAPMSVENSADNDDMVTMFIPMAPNPVTGGFLTYVPRDDVLDIEMTVEDGVRTILTSGVATGKNADNVQLGLSDIQNVARVDQLQDTLRIERDEESN